MKTIILREWEIDHQLVPMSKMYFLHRLSIMVLPDSVCDMDELRRLMPPEISVSLNSVSAN